MRNRLTIIALAIVLWSGGFLMARYQQQGYIEASAQENAAFPLEKMQELSSIINIIKKSYVDDIPTEELIENAIRGMVSGLDPHSTYLSGNQLKQFEKSIRAEQYGGIGIYVGKKGDWIEIISPIDSTPAARAGLKTGDLIIKINGLSTQTMDIDKAVSLMRGEIGEIIALDVLTPGNSPRAIELRREQITAPTAVAGLAESGYGYLRINRFQAETVADTVESINKLYEENDGELNGLILDLRNNPGGLLDVSIGVASIFLPDGVTVVSDRSRYAKNDYLAHKRKYKGLKNEESIKNLNMVILVNNGSASASEIVAGALQDYKRAVILGTQTYGKASVQSFLPLSRDSNKRAAVKLTTARYFTPLDRSIQAVGITPDIVVAPQESIKEKDDDISLREKDLEGHLENPQGESTTESESEDEEKTDIQPFIPQNDHQFDQALLVLKSLFIVGN